MKKIIFCGILVYGCLAADVGLMSRVSASPFYPGKMGAFYGRFAIKGTNVGGGINILFNNSKVAKTSQDGKFKIMLPWGPVRFAAQKATYFTEHFVVNLDDDTSEKFLGYLYKESSTLAQNLVITPVTSPSGCKITYHLNQPSTISLKIIDDTGILYHILENQTQNAGDVQYIWDGKDLNGTPLSPGDYSVVLTVINGDFKQGLLLNFSK